VPAVFFLGGSRVTVGRITAAMPTGRIGALLAPLIVAGAVAAAAAAGMLPLALATSALVILLLVGLRSPLAVLALFAALVPIEDTLTLSGAGTATRLVGLIFAVAYVGNRRQLPRLSTMPAVGWAFLLWAGASGVWAVDFAAWAGAIATLLQMFGLALLVGDLVSRDTASIRTVMWAYSASAVMTVLTFVVIPSLSGVTADRWAAFAGQDPIQYAAVLVPACLFLIYELVQTASSRGATAGMTLVILAGVGLVGWGLMMTGGRGAVLGLGIGVAAMAATGTGHRHSRLSIVAVGLSTAGAALLVPGVAGPILSRFSDAAATGGAGRLDIWSVGATIFAQHPLVGVGYAAFPAAYTIDVIRISAAPGLSPGMLTPGWGPSSLLVGTAAELGMIGLALLALFLWRVVSARSTLGFWNFVRAALFATLAQAMLLDMLERKQLWLLLGIALGIIAAARHPHARAAVG
jgi:O-Antigen ligase